MEKIFEHKTYGLISFKQSEFSGKRTISFNGKPLIKKNNKTFFTEDNLSVKVVGNDFTGIKIQINTDEIIILDKPRWYEILLMCLNFFPLIWGNIPSSVLLFPMVGGAIGGVICGFMATLSLLFARKVEKPIFKVLICLGFFALNVLTCFLIGILIIFAL